MEFDGKRNKVLIHVYCKKRGDNLLSVLCMFQCQECFNNRPPQTFYLGLEKEIALKTALVVEP